MAAESKTSGIFITLEGGEGAGKSTQIDLLKAKLEQSGHKVVTTREPGGTPGAEAIRELILSGSVEDLGPEYEASLFAAARLDHIENVIVPNLKNGAIVICDRFADSTKVYQGYTGNVDLNYLDNLEKLVCEEAWPDITLILDLDPEEGMKRAGKRRDALETPDRFEKEDLTMQIKRREAFLKIAELNPKRCKVVDASGSVEEVHEQIWQAVSSVLQN